MVIMKSELKKMSLEMKKDIVFELFLEAQAIDPEVADRFDPDSDKMIDKKIDVLQKIVEGKNPVDIDGYEDILELEN